MDLSLSTTLVDPFTIIPYIPDSLTVTVLIGGVALAAVAGGISGWWRHGLMRRENDRQDRLRNASPRWARPKDLRDLRIEDPDNLSATRLYLGKLAGTHVANLPYRSVMVIAPTGAGKTPRVAVPMLLRHDGPAVTASIKPDLVHITRHWRESRSNVWYFDITNATGLANCVWSPLADITTYSDALKAARWLKDSSKVEGQTTGDKDWWDQKGAELLAPALFAAAKTGRHISAVVNWIKMVADREVQKILDELRDLDAIASWSATMGREAKMKDSIYATAESILAPFANPEVRERLQVTDPDSPEVFSPAKLLDDDGTLYLLGSIEDQAYYAPVFEAIVNSIVREVQRRAQSQEAQGLPPKKPLLLLIDEAANTASLRDLDKVASAGAGQGICLATFWQDFAQIDEVYGAMKAKTIRSNHTMHLYLPGISDDDTLQALSTAIGSHRVEQASINQEFNAALLEPGRRTASSSWADQDLAPVWWLRQQSAGTAIGLTRETKPMRLVLPGWWEDPALAERVPDEVASRINDHYASLV